MHLGLTEIIGVVLVVILIFGAKKIPELGDAIGKGIRNFKKSTREDDAIDVTPRKSPDQVPTPGASDATSRKA